MGGRTCKSGLHTDAANMNISHHEDDFNEHQFILDAIDDTLMTPQEKILKILKSMR